MTLFHLKGTVIKGRQVGRDLGAPTLNFDSKPVDLEYGVYVGTAVIDGPVSGEQKKYPSVAHWGPRPTFKDEEPILEVHLLDFSDDLYGKAVDFEFVKKLRDIRLFETPEALKNQIAEDLAKAREFFA